MPLVRTTFQPSIVYSVTAQEFAGLRALGVVYGDYRVLYANFLSYSDGPAVPMTAVTIKIGTTAGAGNTVAATAVGVEHVGVGAYLYRWSPDLTPGPGTYHVTWTGTDPDGVVVTATEIIAVPAGS